MTAWLWPVERPMKNAPTPATAMAIMATMVLAFISVEDGVTESEELVELFTDGANRPAGNRRMAGRQSPFRHRFVCAFGGAATRMILAAAAALFVAGFHLARRHEGHAALRAIARFGAHHVGVHRTGVLPAGDSFRPHVLQAGWHVEIQARCRADKNRQYKNAEKQPEIF